MTRASSTPAPTAACPDRYKELTGDELFEGVIRVCDLRDREAILYAEMGEQDCFLGAL